MADTKSDISEPALEPRRKQGRAWGIVKICSILATLVSLLLSNPLWATIFWAATITMDLYTSFKIRHQDIDKPLALFWIGLGEKGFVNIIFLILFWQQLRFDWEGFPAVLAMGVVILTIRNIFYLIFSVSVLKENRALPLNSIWGKTTTLIIRTTMLLYIWKIDYYSNILMVTSILMILATSIGYTYFYYRNEDSRKPFSVATQLTMGRIILSPIFIWVFFYDNDLVYQNNHLIFKVLALIMVILFVISDGLDGYLARKMGEVTNLGKYLDPFSDKISNMSIFLCFLASDFAAIWMVALIYFREATVETLRTLAAAEGVIVDARKSGKWKTAIQGVAIIAILTLAVADTLLNQYISGLETWNTIWNYTPYTLMTLVAIITVLSGVDYVVSNKKVLKHYM